MVGIFPFSVVYISEIAHPDIRAKLSSFNGISNNCGTSIVWILGYFCTWRTVALLSMIPSIITMFFLCFFPETSYWLIENDRIEEGKKSLQFFRGMDFDITNELAEIQGKRLEKKARMGNSWDRNFRRLLSLAFLKPFSCIGVIWSLNMLSGFPVFANYQYDIMELSGSKIEPSIAPMTIGIIRLLLVGK